VLATVLTAALLLPAPAGAPAASAAAACPGANATSGIARRERAVRCLMNRERTSRGLPALRPSGRLALAARRHSRDMVRRRYFDHTSRDGRGPGERITRAGYRWSAYAENIAYGTGRPGTPAGTVRRWMDSPGHRANILSRAVRDVGVGIAGAVPVRGVRGGTTVTADFGRRR
jgi:uncharacterized protein YkwD